MIDSHHFLGKHILLKVNNTKQSIFLLNNFLDDSTKKCGRSISLENNAKNEEINCLIYLKYYTFNYQSILVKGERRNVLEKVCFSVLVLRQALNDATSIESK